MLIQIVLHAVCTVNVVLELSGKWGAPCGLGTRG